MNDTTATTQPTGLAARMRARMGAVAADQVVLCAPTGKAAQSLARHNEQKTPEVVAVGNVTPAVHSEMAESAKIKQDDRSVQLDPNVIVVGRTSQIEERKAAEAQAAASPNQTQGFTVIAAPSELPDFGKPEKPRLPDELYAGDASMFTYHFEDKDRLPIPNDLGWRAIKYLKPNCVQAGRPVIPHTDVNPILAQHGRDDLVRLLKANDDEWIPLVAKQKRASPAP